VPTFRINVVNQHFRSSSEQELANAEAANTAAIKGALQIGTDEVCLDRPFFGAEVSIEHEGQRVGRYIVSVGVSSLK
jgi:hypothetical protein